MRLYSVLFALLCTSAARAQNCSPYLTVITWDQKPTLSLVVREVRRLSSPTIALSTLSDHPDVDALVSLRQNALTTAEWRHLVELAIERTLPQIEGASDAYPDVLEQVFRAVDGFAIPGAGTRPASAWRRWFGKVPSTVWPAADAERESILIRRAFKARSGPDLRQLNPRLAKVKTETRYVDTFTNTLRALFADFAARVPVPKNFDEWTAAIESTLHRDFPQADLTSREFVTTILEQRFLRVPALPSESEIISAVLNSRAAAADVVPSYGLDERVIPTPPVRAPRRPKTIEPAAASNESKPAQLLRLDVHPHAAKEIEDLPPHLRERYARFAEMIVRPDGFRDVSSNPGRWRLERMNWDSTTYSVRLDGGYRVLFTVVDGTALVKRVNKGQIHGN